MSGSLATVHHDFQVDQLKRLPGTKWNRTRASSVLSTDETKSGKAILWDSVAAATNAQDDSSRGKARLVESSMATTSDELKELINKLRGNSDPTEPAMVGDVLALAVEVFSLSERLDELSPKPE
ncbi:MAG TPA: hypothetical protein VHU17_01425 [Acidimicrobiales bacterium]|nr:hypothetical protein [Acidimicrobiales bacterium]